MLWRCRLILLALLRYMIRVHDSTFCECFLLYMFGYFWYSYVFWISEFMTIHPELNIAWWSWLSSSHCLAPHMSNRWIPMFDRRSTGDRGSSSTADYDPHCGSGPLYGYRHGCWEWMKVIGVWDFLSGFWESLRKALWCQMASDQELVYMENPWYFVNSRRRIHMSNRLYLEKKGIACGWKHFFFKSTVPMGTR